MFKEKNKILNLIAIILGIIIVIILILGIIFSQFNKVPKLNPCKVEEKYELSEDYSKEVQEEKALENEAEAFNINGAGITAGESAQQVMEPNGDYICSYASERIITAEDLSAILQNDYGVMPENKSVQQMIVNEMYARRGYQFKSQAIQDYFNTKTWYTQIGTYNPNMDAIYNQMTDIEKSNIDFLQNSDNGGE